MCEQCVTGIEPTSSRLVVQCPRIAIAIVSPRHPAKNVTSIITTVSHR